MREIHTTYVWQTGPKPCIFCVWILLCLSPVHSNRCSGGVCAIQTIDGQPSGIILHGFVFAECRVDDIHEPKWEIPLACTYTHTNTDERCCFTRIRTTTTAHCLYCGVRRKFCTLFQSYTRASSFSCWLCTSYIFLAPHSCVCLKRIEFPQQKNKRNSFSCFQAQSIRFRICVICELCDG